MFLRFSRVLFSGSPPRFQWLLGFGTEKKDLTATSPPRHLATLPAGRTTPAGANAMLRSYSIGKDQSGIGLHRLTLIRGEDLDPIGGYTTLGPCWNARRAKRPVFRQKSQFCVCERPMAAATVSLTTVPSRRVHGRLAGDRGDGCYCLGFYPQCSGTIPAEHPENHRAGAPRIES